MGCSGVCGRCVCLCLDSGDGHTGRTMHDLRQFGRARPDPVLLDCAHEPVWLYLCLLPIVNQTAAHAPLLRREHERPPCLHRYQRPTGFGFDDGAPERRVYGEQRTYQPLEAGPNESTLT